MAVVRGWTCKISVTKESGDCIGPTNVCLRHRRTSWPAGLSPTRVVLPSSKTATAYPFGHVAHWSRSSAAIPSSSAMSNGDGVCFSATLFDICSITYWFSYLPRQLLPLVSSVFLCRKANLAYGILRERQGSQHHLRFRLASCSWAACMHASRRECVRVCTYTFIQCMCIFVSRTRTPHRPCHSIDAPSGTIHYVVLLLCSCFWPRAICL